jgi:hypothetical protein
MCSRNHSGKDGSSVMTRVGTVQLAIPVLLLAACGAEPVESRTESDEIQLGVTPLSLAELAGSQLTTAVLNASNAAAMGQTQTARKVLAFAVACALNSTQTVTYTVGGTSYTETGMQGIAPGWKTASITASEAAWVSACMFSHVNEVTHLVWLSLRGSQSSLATTSQELTDYKVEEGAFWGNLFTNLGSIHGYSCLGVDQAITDSYGELPYRNCAQWDGVSGSNASPCGMSYAGLCRTACTTASAPYSGCSFQGGSASSSVVTIFLAGALPP